MNDTNNNDFVRQAAERAKAAREDHAHGAGVAGGEEMLDPAAILTRFDLVKNGAQVADLGVGSMPYFSMQAGKMAGTEGKLYIVDIQKPVLAAAENYLKMNGHRNVVAVWSDLETFGATDIPSGAIDVAFVVNVLFQSKARPALIAEAARLLKSEGKLLVIDYLPETGIVAPSMTVNPKEVIDSAAAAGLVLGNEFAAGKRHFGLLFVKRSI